METLLSLNYQELFASGLFLVGSFATFLTALAAFFALIPGEQPEKFIQSVADFISKYSKK